MGYIGLNMDFEWAMFMGLFMGFQCKEKCRGIVWIISITEERERERDIYIYDMIYVFACICIYVCMYIYIYII